MRKILVLRENMKKIIIASLIFFTFQNIFSETIQFSSDFMNGNTSSNSEKTNLVGNAFVKTENMEIKADSIELSGENFRYIQAEGKVSGKNTESKLDFTCGKLKYDRTTKIAVLEDSVNLIDLENEVNSQAQIIQYNQDSGLAVMQINVNIKQKDNVCTGAYAIYQKNEQILKLNGNPKIVQGQDSFRAQEILLNLETQEITLDGRVSGTVTETKNEDTTQNAEQISDSKNEAAPKTENELPAEENSSDSKNENLPESENEIPPSEKPLSDSKNEEKH